MVRVLDLAPILLIASSLACAHSKIPGTNIEDTEENKEILSIVEEYRRALEARDANAVIAMVSPRYYEDNGNTDRSDDYDFNQLRDQLNADFDRAKKIQVELRIDDVEVNEDEERAYAYVYYQVRAQSEFPTGLKWKTNNDRARFEFERKDGRWLILSGL